LGVAALELLYDNKNGLVSRERRLATEEGVTRERFHGYEDAFLAAGLSLDDATIVESTNDAAAGRAVAAILFDKEPDMTAVLAMSDVLAFAVMDVARQRGRQVPLDLSIVGFDDVPEAVTAVPPLTTVRQPIVEKGRRAAQLIFDRGEPRKEVLPVSLVVRSSTAPPRPR
jgi:DNA-binding LacI/PurR family transcriptional regulator